MKGPLPAWLEGKTAEQKENKRADYQLSSHASCPRHWQQAILQSMSSYQQALYCTCSTLSLRRGLFWVLISSELHSPMRHYRSTFLPLPPRRRCHCCSRLALPDLLKFLSLCLREKLLLFSPSPLQCCPSSRGDGGLIKRRRKRFQVATASRRRKYARLAGSHGRFWLC